MAIPTTIESLSTTAASNGPAGSDDRSTADDGLRQAYAFIKQGVSLGSNIASASSIAPPSTASVFNITGTTAITTIASTYSWDGRVITLIFAGALTLTHSSNLALPGAANITTAANDVATFVQTASGAWRCVCYTAATEGILTRYLPLAGGTMTGAVSGITDLTTTGNTILGNAVGDTVDIAGSHVIVNASGQLSVNMPSGPAAGSSTANFVTASQCYTIQLYGGAYPAAMEMSSNSQPAWYVTAGTGGTFAISTANGTAISVEKFNTSVGPVISVGTDGQTTFAAPTNGFYALTLPSKTPATASSTGVTGNISWDSSYIYVCTSTNTWKRAALSSW